MKKVIFAIAILMGLSAAVIAQTSSSSKKVKTTKEKTEMKMKMKEGVMMVDNKMMLCKEGKCTHGEKGHICGPKCPENKKM